MGRSGELAAERRSSGDGVDGGRHGDRIGEMDSKAERDITWAGQLSYKLEGSLQPRKGWSGQESLLFSSDCNTAEANRAV